MAVAGCRRLAGLLIVRSHHQHHRSLASGPHCHIRSHHQHHRSLPSGPHCHIKSHHQHHRSLPSGPFFHIRSHLLSTKPNTTNSFTSTSPPPLFSTSMASTTTTTTTSRGRSTASGSKLGLVLWYLAMLESRPVLTKSLTAAAIFTAADVSSQMVTHGPKDSFDLIRTVRMASYGLLISGPSLHLWFNFLSRILPRKDLLTTFKKMAMGQVVYGPIIASAFYSYNAALNGETVPEITARLRRDLIPTLKTGLLYWPLCDFITFKFFPVRLQPLVSNSFSFLWTIYLTYMASLKKASVEKVATE